MASCKNCGTTILFGGIKDGEYRFCSEKCHQAGYLFSLAPQIPDDVVEKHTWSVFSGNCQKCNNGGPIDLHTSYKIWSALYLTKWSSHPVICCEACGKKTRYRHSLYCFLLGWWGFPWGLIMTPVQITRNLKGNFKTPNFEPQPSNDLRKTIRLNLAAELARKQGTQ